MADIPPEAVQRAAEVMFGQYESQYEAGHLTWQDFAEDARAVLEAAVPFLAAGVGDARLALIRRHTENFLAEYGNSTIPMFEIAKDVCNATLKILDGELDGL